MNGGACVLIGHTGIQVIAPWGKLPARRVTLFETVAMREL